MKLYDYDNLTGREINAAEVKKLRTAFDAGQIVGMDGPYTWEDALDRDRDICLDEDGYDCACSLLDYGYIR